MAVVKAQGGYGDGETIYTNSLIQQKYLSGIMLWGEDAVKTKLFLTDHTHTTEAGAIINAASVAEGIKALKGCRLKKYLLKNN
jgi:hypothetical protein